LRCYWFQQKVINAALSTIIYKEFDIAFADPIILSQKSYAIIWKAEVADSVYEVRDIQRFEGYVMWVASPCIARHRRTLFMVPRMISEREVFLVVTKSTNQIGAS
jgi:hypothetical protein